ncbi:MAG: MFS family permease [Zhongshania aliphaticivorans]|jgi:MFS family permease|uniref:spinster family MFS transporter n=1 Tax=Zhongshania aliphaticivorans TaxID=1470434 RepID=UPI0039E39C30
MISPSVNAGPSADDKPYPNHAYACYVIFVLFVVTVLSQLDRQLPTLLVEPIRREFAISDTAFSFLQGYAFSLVYTFAGLPLGRLVDQRSRRLLIFWGLLFWSLMTVFAGFAQNYTSLFMARMGVGIGEAVLAPAAYSIIADYFAPARRGRALGIYYISIAIGSGASLLLGGYLLQLIPSEGMTMPFIGHLLAWRWVFIVAGLPGLLLSVLMFTIREPERRELAQRRNVPISELLAFLRGERATFGRLLFYPSILAIIGYGSLAWAPSVFTRRFNLDISHSGMLLGGLIAAAGILGGLISGHLSDYWRTKGLQAARFRVALVGQLLLLPCVSTWSLMPTSSMALGVLFFAVLGLSIAQSAAPAAIQEVTPNTMRGQVIAIYLLLGGLLGIGLGPTLVAVTSDLVFAGEALHLAVSATAFPVSLLGLWLCWSGQSRYALTRERIWGGDVTADRGRTLDINKTNTSSENI